jgi:hypothetical protein
MKLDSLHANQEDSVRDLVLSIAISVQASDLTFHATPSFSPRWLLSWQSRALRSFSAHVGEVLDEVLDLFTGGFPKCFHPAEVSRVRLDEVRI